MGRQRHPPRGAPRSCYSRWIPDMRSVIGATAPGSTRCSRRGSFSTDTWVMHFTAHTSVGFATSERVPSGFGPMVGSPGRWAPPRFCTKDPPFLYSHIYNPNLPPDIHTAPPASTLRFLPSHLFFPLPLPGSWFALLGILLGFRQIGSCSEGGGCLASYPLGRGTEQLESDKDCSDRGDLQGCKFFRGACLAAT